MRKILFRARTISENEYMDGGEWIEGFYTCFNEEEHRIYTGYSETDCDDHYPDWFNVLPETVGQFTGIYDKNGKKIFEGDIIDVEYDIQYIGVAAQRIGLFEVVFDNGCFMKKRKNKGLFHFINSDKCKIVGNIYDTPEILKQEEIENEIRTT